MHFIYMMASKRNGVLYVGSTSHLIQRIRQHKLGTVDGFTRKFCIKRLVYIERVADAKAAFKRERQIKEWKRGWKTELIERANPEWHDLSQRPDFMDLHDADAKEDPGFRRGGAESAA